MNIKTILQSRWFPQVATHLLAGLVASGVVYGLRAAGVTNVVPWEVNNALTPIIGFLVAAVARRPQPAPADEPVSATQGTVGSQVAQMLLGDVTAAIDANPALVKNLALGLLTGGAAGASLPKPVAALDAKVLEAGSREPAEDGVVK